MYKTIRHGENSLQYTILPQNDDFRVDGGRLTGNGNKRSTRKCTRRAGRRKSCFAYCGLIFICTVIIGAVLVPLLVSTDYLPTPSTWFLHKKIISSATTANTDTATVTLHDTTNNNQIVNQSENAVNMTMTTRTTKIAKTTTAPKTELSTIGFHKFASTFKLKIRNTSISKDPENDNTNSLGQSPSDNEMNSNKLFDSFGIVPTNDDSVVVKKIKPVTTTTEFVATPSTNDDKFLLILNSTHRNKTLKGPVTFPVLAKTNTVLIDNGIVRVANKNNTKSWIKSHWPFVDPSTYFQWIGYRSEDSVLLPAILGAALIGIILIITLCLVARNKKTIVMSMKKRNRNTNKENGEVNATLLTNSNLSEEE